MAGRDYERRLDNVRVLLRTLNDIYPGPQSASAIGLSGSVPSSRVPCTFCHRSGKAYSPALKRVTACPVCDGAKWRKRRPGDPVYDEYTEQPIATAAQPKKAEPMSPARLEAEIAKTQRTLMLSEGLVDPNDSFGWEREREDRDRYASYPELERVLGVMQIEFPLGRSVITDVYLGGLGGTIPAYVDRALVGWIADRMRGPVRIPRDVYKAQQEELRKEARELLRKGFSEAEIMAELGVSRRFTRTVSAGTLRVSTGPPPAPEVAVT